MAKLYELKTFESNTGNLTVFEGIIPGVIQRVFYIYEAGHTARAGHRHHRTWQALVCLSGSCRVYNNNGTQEDTFLLTNPRQCLVLQPEDWHIMDSFSDDAILLVISNELYDKNDYIYEPYPNGNYVDRVLMADSE
ncbi:sugar 3,4-ketoisomerase [Spirosoma radiotolerans]|uniref:WxcM domain-containing protein n=1 Tax=Spirosoma radiotolerans TaxID=1379870 RepID=A0A0E3V691_9BACT|nr:FdtA/QdtA family cupin domain-containing protein [Spirosoma radiotolerans]AKD54326.1 WxcM domain-containing protein [Spirosoma radiotolerans]